MKLIVVFCLVGISVCSPVKRSLLDNEGELDLLERLESSLEQRKMEIEIDTRSDQLEEFETELERNAGEQQTLDEELPEEVKDELVREEHTPNEEINEEGENELVRKDQSLEEEMPEEGEEIPEEQEEELVEREEFLKKEDQTPEENRELQEDNGLEEEEPLDEIIQEPQDDLKPVPYGVDTLERMLEEEEEE